MHEFLEDLWAAVKAIFWLADKTLRVLTLLAGIMWLFSAKYRDEVSKQPWYSRWLVYDGAFEVVLVTTVIIAIGVAGFIGAMHR